MEYVKYLTPYVAAGNYRSLQRQKRQVHLMVNILDYEVPQISRLKWRRQQSEGVIVLSLVLTAGNTLRVEKLQDK